MFYKFLLSISLLFSLRLPLRSCARRLSVQNLSPLFKIATIGFSTLPLRFALHLHSSRKCCRRSAVRCRSAPISPSPFLPPHCVSFPRAFLSLSHRVVVFSLSQRTTPMHGFHLWKEINLSRFSLGNHRRGKDFIGVSVFVDLASMRDQAYCQVCSSNLQFSLEFYVSSFSVCNK
jgi:hypothetical protein